MNFKPRLVTPPVGEVLTLQEVKEICIVDTDNTDDDNLLNSYIAAMHQYLDGYDGILGRALITQTWVQPFEKFIRLMRLPFVDADNVVVTYTDADGNEQTLSEGFEVGHDHLSSFIRFKPSVSLPYVSDDVLEAVKIQFTSGFGNSAGDIPEPIKTAMKFMIYDWYENGNSDVISYRAKMILMNYKRVGV